MEEAEWLKLRTVRPATRTRQAQAEGRRVARMHAGRTTLVVSHEDSKPWELEGVSRSAWFAKYPSAIDKQIRSVDAVLSRGDPRSINAAELAVVSALAVRFDAGEVVVEVDRLFEHAMKCFGIERAVHVCPRGGGMSVFESGRVSKIET
jgi:hypothetical protein